MYLNALKAAVLVYLAWSCRDRSQAEYYQTLLSVLNEMENWLIEASCLSTHTESVREHSAGRARRQHNLGPQPAFD